MQEQLERDDDPAGGFFQALSRAELPDEYEVTLTTAADPDRSETPMI